MRSSCRALVTSGILWLAVLCATTLVAQNTPNNPGIFQGYKTPVSSTLRFWASEQGKQALLHSPSRMALPLLQRFHPEAVGQYPQEPMLQSGPQSSFREPISITGCGTTSGTVMNLEPATDAVSQQGPSVDFILSELGSGKDLVAETATDARGETGGLDSLTGIYVHRDGTVPCYGGTDFEMGNSYFADPFNNGAVLFSTGGGLVLADPSSAHKQFLFVDTVYDGTTSGIGLRRVPTSNFESTSTCPAGTLSGAQEATCLGSKAVVVEASEDNLADQPVIAQDPRSSGTGAGDIYIVNVSLRYLRSVMTLTACKATFTTSADCSSPVIVSGSEDGTAYPSVAVVGGGPNAGGIAITYVDGDDIVYISCTPAGAPSHPTCGHHSTVRSGASLVSLLTNNNFEVTSWPQIVARTDSGGQTLFVVWAGCKVVPTYPLIACPDSDIDMSVATNVTSPSWAFHHVSTASGHQYMPADRLRLRTEHRHRRLLQYEIRPL